MNGLSFSSQPTSGQYIQRHRHAGRRRRQLILDIIGAVPANGSAFTLTTGGAVVNWLPANPGEANLAVTQSVDARAGGGRHAAELRDHGHQRRSSRGRQRRR